MTLTMLRDPFPADLRLADDLSGRVFGNGHRLGAWSRRWGAWSWRWRSARPTQSTASAMPARR
jgi:hypothetical protein